MSDSSLTMNAPSIGASTARYEVNFATDQVWRIVVAFIGFIIIIGAFFAPAFPFTSDGAIHAEIVRAFTERGVLYIAENGAVDGAPPMVNVSTHAYQGLVYPQYPSGYGVVGAPFYALFGMRGLVMLNALSALGILFLTFYIARTHHNKAVAQMAVLILAFGTFFWNYAFAIWPHMFALLVWISAAALAVRSDVADTRRTQLGLIGLTGLIIGFGVSVRVDIILAIPAIYAWLRLFARPDDRLSAIAFLAALIPGLLAAAAFNDVKFGVASPVFYGDKSGPDGLSHYMWLLPTAALGVLLSLAINFPKALTQARTRITPKHLMVGGGIAFVAAIIVLAATGMHERILFYFYSIYVLVVDLQGYNSGFMQLGVEYNEYGHLLFWTFPKRALLQSIPFACLLILPAIDFFRGKSLKAHSLAALIIFAPICFYAIKQWHGGGAYNMRYFVPTLPFISILSAVALQKLLEISGPPERRHVFTAIVAGAVLYSVADQISKSSEALYVPFALYPQLFIAAALSIPLLIIGLQANPNRLLVRSTLLCSLSALAFAGMVSLSDESTHEKSRGLNVRQATAMESALPKDALVVTSYPILFLGAQKDGLSVFYLTEETAETSITAIDAFERADRCVYFHNAWVPHLLEPVIAADRIDMTSLWAGGARSVGEEKLQLFVLATQREKCSI